MYTCVAGWMDVRLDTALTVCSYFIFTELLCFCSLVTVSNGEDSSVSALTLLSADHRPITELFLLQLSSNNPFARTE
jgi:hypothetical protein